MPTRSSPRVRVAWPVAAHAPLQGHQLWDMVRSMLEAPYASYIADTDRVASVTAGLS